MEKLKAENRLLRAEKKKQQMEIDLLKKLEEIGMRWLLEEQDILMMHILP